ncbi:MAG: beta-galactosidase, partial [Leifsonia sp.]
MSTTTTETAPHDGTSPVAARTKIAFGCDYNPEQWSPDVWADDIRLMREAGISIVAINVFGWAQLEPRAGVYDFSGLDAVVELLHAAGIRLNLGTGTASPPPWLSAAHPEILPMAADGTRRWPGGRQAYCPSSPVFREHAVRLATAVAERYGSHPAVELWHVSNELGCHNALCYCDVSAQAFRVWLRAKYGTLDALNTAWGTSFWSQRFGEWGEILPPRRTLSAANPAQALDFSRFSSDEVLECYLMEERVLRRMSAVPVTTNFMVTAHIRTQNYWDWAPHVDIVANDHYLDHRLEDPHQELSFAADLTRGLAGGKPWLLMEQATGAVNWQPHNLAKAPNELLRNTMTHVARGADGVCFFQWRASAQGTEKFHSGLIPHAGTDSHKWREVLELSRTLDSIGEVTGTEVVSEAAILFSWESWWALDLDSHPSQDVRYLEQVHAAYRALWDAGVTVDVVEPGSDLSAYRLVVVPALYLISDTAAASVSAFVANGGSAFVTFFSGIVDEDDRIRLGGYPGAFLDVLGVRVDEFFPLASGQTVHLDDGASASIWTERIEPRSAEVISSFSDGPLRGGAALTRNTFGSGSAWYVGAALERDALRRALTAAADEAGVTRSEGGLGGVETVLRRGPEAEYLFLINHGDSTAISAAAGYELIT